jgi:F0F1-type ATP synthase assembly protein I
LRVQLRERQAMWQGFGDALGQAVDLVVTPLLLFLLGWWLDGRFGTRPLLAIVLGLLGVIGVSVRAYYTYRAAMESAEEGKPWTRRNPK